MPEPSSAPSNPDRINHRGQVVLDRLRHQLAHLDALPQLTILGFFAGLAAAGIIVAFRLLIDLPLAAAFASSSENFESLPRHWHFLLPVLGALLLGLIMHFIPPERRQVSVGHVLDRLHNHQGKLPAGNWAWQFSGGIIALLSGQSMGREGPAVHLGAGAASQLGQWLALPNNCLRTLIGCGVASAIAASFNTPMAGVIFSMEVILMEYTIAGFIPVMLASVTGATVCHLIFGEAPAFTINPPQMNDLLELPLIVFTGLAAATLAAGFIRLQLLANRQQHWPVVPRLLLAGTITGSLALFCPQILGVGYDTIDGTMQGEIAVPLLLAIVLSKLVATSVSGGLGVPAGVIGPSLFIGAALGGCLGAAGTAITPESGANPSFYVLLGMSAMMAAVINAPLTALITVFELTQNPHVVFPTMLIVVVAVLTTRQVFRCEGIFLAQLKANGFNLNTGPIRQALNRVGVRSAMETNYLRSPNRQTLAQLKNKLQQHPKWLLVDEPEKDKYLLSAADISAFLDNRKSTEQDARDPATASDSEDGGDVEIKLLDIPGRQWLLKPIQQQASLYEAQQVLEQHKADALYVERRTSTMLSPVLGIITGERIKDYYKV
ncbi:chloride channel protein [Pseudomaricurvus alcaniphilus]|uniref:chloride channel protein n=1 Tax=Pseudomaricurvus alcaniphilus TaxID=1166482 RepID=UPI00140D8A98|nr:chloride channel protein [Pseudomaricurvus alcaniphilus]NHN38896.1 chloride channel protein [Pseudomaricurvus alcaniphilus]